MIKIRIKEALDIRQSKTGEKINQSELAKMLKHKSKVSNLNFLISRCKHGKASMPSEILLQIANICGVTTDFLLYEKH